MGVVESQAIIFGGSVIPIGAIATGTPDGTKFVRDDGTLATPPGGGSGDVVGPASSVDNSVVRFDLATGKLIQGSVVIIGDGGLMSGFSRLEANPGAAPKYTFVSYTTTGLFFDDSAETLGLQYIGTNVLYYDNSVSGIVIPSLSGAGSRMVVADATGAMSTAAIPSGSFNTLYAPGSFTVATGNFALHCKRLQLTTTQRMTLAGTARFRLMN